MILRLRLIEISVSLCSISWRRWLLILSRIGSHDLHGIYSYLKKSTALSYSSVYNLADPAPVFHRHFHLLFFHPLRILRYLGDKSCTEVDPQMSMGFLYWSVRRPTSWKVARFLAADQTCRNAAQLTNVHRKIHVNSVIKQAILLLLRLW